MSFGVCGPREKATAAEADGVKVFKVAQWRLNGQAIPEVLADYKSVGATLNVMPFCTQYIPIEVITHPKHQTIAYHPSILPRHRGSSAINWTLMQGDKRGGFTIFWADEGLDTGPIILQRATDVDPDDTLDTFYGRFCYPEGVKAMGEAVEMIAKGSAPKIVQPEEGATCDLMITKDKVEIDWSQTAQQLHNFIRGNDKVPGAWTTIDGEQVTFFGSKLWTKAIPKGIEIAVEGMSQKAVVHDGGMLLFGTDGKATSVNRVQFGSSGKMIKACKYGQVDETANNGV